MMLINSIDDVSHDIFAQLSKHFRLLYILHTKHLSMIFQKAHHILTCWLKSISLMQLFIRRINIWINQNNIVMENS